MVGYGSLLSFFVFMLKFKSLNVTANVSFYLIAILAQPVKIHSLQKRNVDRHVKKKCIYNNYSPQMELPNLVPRALFPGFGGGARGKYLATIHRDRKE